MLALTYGHWTAQKEVDVSQFGFLYVITNTVTGRKYIGIKQFSFKRGKRRIPSDWLTYTGSSTSLNEDITKLGKDKFTFEIVATFPDKPSLKYAEAKEIINTSAIWSSDYYNKYVGLRLVNRKKV